MAEKVSITKRVIADAKPPETGRRYIYDDKAPGLQLCITAAGAKTWYWYGRVNGKPCRVRIGGTDAITPTQARDRALEIAADAARGINTNEARRAVRGEMTLGELFDWYMEHHAKPHKRTWKRDESRFNSYLSHWKGRRLSAISTAEIQALHSRLGKTAGPYAANDTMQFLSHLYRKAIEIGWDGRNPVRGIKRFRERERDRFLLADELPRFFAAVANITRETTRDYILVSLFCGARRANVTAMRWDDLDLEQKTWRVAAEASKNNEPMTVVLPQPAVDILQRRYKARGKSPFVFPGQGKTGHLVEPKHAWKRVLQEAGLENLRIHDLRRTLGSWQAAGGASLLVIGKSLGHTSTSATKVYARLAIDPVRESVEAAAKAIEAASQKKSEKSPK